MRFETVLRIENYTGLITGLAVSCWKKMPLSHKAWISIDDLVNDGMVYARFSVMKTYDYRKASFTTYLQNCMSQYYVRRIGALYRQKRLPIEIEVETHYHPAVVNQMIASDGRKAMARLRMMASPLLRRYLDDWFYSGGHLKRLVISKRFKKARSEFLMLARECGVDVSVCRSMLEMK